MTKIPERPPLFVCSGDGHGMRIARPVAGASQWYEANLGVNWLLGKGNHLASATPMEGAVDGAITAGSTRSIPLYVAPLVTTKAYCWTVTLFAGGAGGAYGTFLNVSDETIGEWTLTASDIGRGKTFDVVVAEAGTPAAGVLTLKVHNATASVKSVYVVGLGLFELPRRDITTNPRIDSCRSHEPIFEEPVQNLSSLDGVLRKLPAACEAARRPNMMHWWSPTPRTTTSSSPQPVAAWYMQPRHTTGDTALFQGTTRTITFQALCSATGGNGELIVSTGPEGTLTPTVVNTVIPSGGYAYVANTIAVGTEDPGNLLNAGLLDDLRQGFSVEIRTNGGSAAGIQAFHAYEAT